MDTAEQQLLLIDNDDVERESVAAYLKGAGFIVLEARNVSQGLDLLADHQPEVVLCDLNAPGTDAGALRAIKSDFADTPVIVMATDGVMSDVVWALRYGAADYLIKPIADMEVLEHAISRCQEQSQLRQQNLDYRQKLEQANLGLQQSLKVLELDQLAGREVQLKMLPPSTKQFGKYQFSHRIIPSFYLSGDFVDYFMVGNDFVVYFIADVSGHGASSAFVTVLLKNMFARKRSDYLHQNDISILSPAAMLDIANRNLLNTDIGKHATLCVGVIDLRTDTLCYSVAGHLPLPMLTVDGSTEYLQTEGMPVGLFETAEYTEATIPLPANAVLTLFSDGILEVISVKGVLGQEKYLLKQLSNGPDSIDGVLDDLGLSKIDEVPDDIAVLLITKDMISDSSILATKVNEGN
ncbi:MAG: fused response regulator/phosphatase [Oceanicoccus sp.]